MTQLLVQGGVILAQGPLSVNDDEIHSSDAIYPAHVIPGWQIVEAALPTDFSTSRYQWVNGALQKYLPPPAASDVANFVKQVDVDTDAIYAAAIGNREAEYNQANADAQAYKSAGYTGTVPSSVQSWATAKGWTTQAAADDILTAAARLAAARDAIRSNRLQSKEVAKRALTVDALAMTQQAWAAFVTSIKSQLGI